MSDAAGASGDQSVLNKGHLHNSTINTGTITHIHPPAAPGYSPRHQLPSDLPDFTGRETEVKDLIAALDRDGGGAAAVSAIRGMGGIGKTTLAVHAARRLLDRYPDAQILVNLQGHSEAPSLTPMEAMAHVVRAFHPELKAEDDPQRMEAIYRSVLAGQRALIILDNAADTAQVESLVPPPPCGLIVTARDPIRLHGAVPLRLGLLPRGESVALLRSAAHPAQATEEEWDQIAELCDDLPLALRVAGSFLAHAEDCSAADYIADLTDARTRLDHLTVSGTRGDVGAVLAHSARRLAESDPALAARWQCLSVFPADFDRPAAAAVWRFEEEKEAAVPLRALLERGLLLYDGDTKRYRLHDLTRPLARDVFAAVPDKDPLPGSAHRINDASEKFSAHYFDVLNTCQSHFTEGRNSIVVGLSLYDKESTNILKASEWSFNLMNSNNTALKIAANFPSSGSRIFSLRLPPLQHICLIEIALNATKLIGDENLESYHLGNLGNIYAEISETRRAIEQYEQTLIIAHKFGDWYSKGNSLCNLGRAYSALGEIPRAIEYYNQALDIAREFRDRRGEGSRLGNLGNAYAVLGETQRAIEHYEQALAITREIGDWTSQGYHLCNLGNAYIALGEIQHAIRYYKQALFIALKLGDRRSESGSLSNLGRAYATLGETQRAIELFTQALAISRESGNRLGEGVDLHNLGNAHLELGEIEQAIAYLEQAHAIFETIESPYTKLASQQLAKLRAKPESS